LILLAKMPSHEPGLIIAFGGQFSWRGLLIIPSILSTGDGRSGANNDYSANKTELTMTKLTKKKMTKNAKKCQEMPRNAKKVSPE